MAADAAKKSGKLKLFGLSTHHKDRAVILQTAAEVGFHRRDHGAVFPLARQAVGAEQGA